MSAALVFRTRARTDIAEAYAWYEVRKQGLGELFLYETQQCLQVILHAPNGFQRVHGHFRQAPMGRFPYVIVYRPTRKEVVILRVFHTSQDPRKKLRHKR